MTKNILQTFVLSFSISTMVFAQSNLPTKSQFQPYSEINSVPKNMIFNIGYSQLERSNYVGPAASGLSFEAQYSFYKRVLGTATFNHYDYTDGGGSSSFQMVALGSEVQPIQTELLGGSQFFAAVTGGAAVIFKRNGLNLYYGAGMGFKINPDMGVRFDIKTGPNYITSNTLALVGYY